MTGLIRAALLSVALIALTVPTAHAESVPLRSEGGTFVVPVLINDKITLDFTLDSGAADVSIPLDVFSRLVGVEAFGDKVSMILILGKDDCLA